MSKQLNNRKNFLEIVLQNLTDPHSKIAKLSKVAKSSVIDIEEIQGNLNYRKKKRRWKEQRFCLQKQSDSIIQSITKNPCQPQRDLAKKFE